MTDKVALAAVFALILNQGGHILQSSTVGNPEAPAQFPNLKQVAVQYPDITFQNFLRELQSKPKSKAKSVVEAVPGNEPESKPEKPEKPEETESKSEEAKSKPEESEEAEEPEEPEGESKSKPKNQRRRVPRDETHDLLFRFLQLDIERTESFKSKFFVPDLAQALASSEYDIFWKNATKLKAQENKQELFIQFLDSIIREVDERKKYLS